MKQVINCFKEENPLINKPLREVSVKEGMEIATELFEILNKPQPVAFNTLINQTSEALFEATTTV